MQSEWTRRNFLGAAAFAGRLRTAEEPGERIAIYQDRQPLVEYRYGADKPKPYVHPFYFPGAIPATLDAPPDHVHHRGLMLAWSKVNGFDFWGEQNPAPHGRIVHQRFERVGKETPAEMVAINHWIADVEVLLVERRSLHVPRPAGGVWLEWRSELRAVKPVVVSAEGHPYDGLGIRFIPAMDGGKVLNARGSTEIARANGEPARWCTFYGGPGGVAIFDWPGNPRHPTPFFVMNDPFGYLSAAPTFREPFQLAADQVLRFRWGVLSYLGKPTARALDRRFDAWRGEERT